MTICHRMEAMLIIGKDELTRFFIKHPQSKRALLAWTTLIAASNYGNLNELHKTFPSADYVHHQYTIFNISGNKYRLVTIIEYSVGIVRVKRIWTHAEYSMSKNKASLEGGRL